MDCARMLQAQQVYAPDPPAIWSEGGISLGRRLFRLLPEDRFDRGPAVSEDGRRVLVGDVRLDDRPGLAAALGLPAERARRLSDASLLLLALEKWEEGALDRLVGDFAFACWDGRRRRLLLARDFLGQRPLHYHAHPDFFAFASMPKGLHALEQIVRKPDTAAVSRFLALIPEQDGNSFFHGVSRLPPGHFAVVTKEGVSVRRYWDPPRTELRLPRAEDYAEALREGVDRAVAARLRGAEGGLATQLSGGLDSSTVTATAARLLGASARICAFTSVPRAGYDGPVPRGRFGDEGPLAATVARLYPQIDHVLVRTSGRSPAASLDRNFFLFERPFLNLCNGVWIDAIADAARERGLRVLLTGQHGNMSISYGGLEYLPELMAKGRLLRLAGLIRGLPRHGLSLEGALARTIGPFLPRSLWTAINRARGRHLNMTDVSAVSPAVTEGLEQDAARLGLDLSYRPRRDPFGTRLWVLRRSDPGNYNKGYLGGWGLDMRDPTADRRLVELCLSIPPQQFLGAGQPGALARTAFADRLPPEILREKRKGLQGIDWHEGLDAARAGITEEVDRLGAVEAAGQALDLPKLRDLVAEWPRGGWHQDKTGRLYRLALLRGLSAGHFIRKASGSNA